MPSAETHALNSVRGEAGSLVAVSSNWGGAWNALLGVVARVLNAIGSAWIFGLMCMMLADLGMRFFFSRPIHGVAEVAGLSIVGIVYLQLASTVQGGRMVKADFISQWLVRKAPRLGHVLGALFHLLGACTMAGLAYVSLDPFVSAWVDREMLGTAGVFQIVTWPFRGTVLMGSFLAMLCYLTLVLRELSLAATQGTRL
jgi:TRAP-type mannitol/chloroaromatic compound transport system permease small subunit